MKRIKITNFMETEFFNVKDEDFEKCVGLIEKYRDDNIEFEGSLYDYLDTNGIDWQGDKYDFCIECNPEFRM
jgi:hypothetical protein